jgi:hypothetical protein
VTESAPPQRTPTPDAPAAPDAPDAPDAAQRRTPDDAAQRRTGQGRLRLAFLVLLGGGLLLIAQLRPRELPLLVDLAAVQPQGLAAVDLVISRDGTALFRLEQRFGAAGAPELLRATVRARPGPVEAELTLSPRAGQSVRSRRQLLLDEDETAVLRADPGR